MNRLKLLPLLFVFALTGSVIAQPTLHGVQSGILGPGTYIVDGSIRVMSGETLTIVAGTEFLHNGHWTWDIYGQLNVEGEEGDSVVFKRQFPDEICKWGGIRFAAGASANSTIDYAIIDNCKNGTTPYYIYGGGIYSNGVPITITNSRISECDAYWNGGGIYADGANIIIDHCIIVDCEAFSGANGGGIYLNNCSDASITNSIIARNISTGT